MQIESMDFLNPFPLHQRIQFGEDISFGIENAYIHIIVMIHKFYRP